MRFPILPETGPAPVDHSTLRYDSAVKRWVPGPVIDPAAVTAMQATIDDYQAGQDATDTAVTSLVNDDLSALRGALTRSGNRPVGQGELVLNVRDARFGAVGDGTTDDTTAIQAAINACAAGGGTVYLPAGTYRVTSLTITGNSTILRGAGRSQTILLTSTGNLITLGGLTATVGYLRLESMRLRSLNGGGHVFHVPHGVHQSVFLDLWIDQQNDAKSILHCNRTEGATPGTTGGLFDNHFTDGYYVHTINATVPAFYVTGVGNAASANRFHRLRVQWGFDFFHLEAGANNFIFNNIFDTINFEICNKGGVRILSGLGNGLHNLGFFDNGTITRDLIHIGRFDTTRPPSRSNVITNYTRAMGTLSGAKDIRLATGASLGSSTLAGISGGSGAGVTVDLGVSGYAVVTGYDSAYVTIENASATNTVLVTATSGIVTPKLKLGSIHLRDNAGTLEKSTDGTTWTVV